MRSYEELNDHLDTVKMLQIRIRIVHGNRPSCYFIAGEVTNDSPPGELMKFEDIPTTGQYGPDNKRVQYTAEQTDKIMGAIRKACDWGPRECRDPKFVSWQEELSREIYRTVSRLPCA